MFNHQYYHFLIVLFYKSVIRNSMVEKRSHFLTMIYLRWSMVATKATNADLTLSRASMIEPPFK